MPTRLLPTFLLSLLLCASVCPAVPAASLDGVIETAALLHDSRDPGFRSPGGAVAAGTPVRLRLRAARGDLSSAQVRVWNERTNVQSLLPMAVVGGDPDHDYWQATLATTEHPSIYGYQFVVADGAAQAWYQDDAAATGGVGEAGAEAHERRWEIGAYQSSFQTPGWLSDAIVYHLLPDRFRNGDTGNDTAEGSFFYGESSTLYRSGGTDWNTPVCDPRPGGSCAGHFEDNFYGGDLQGVIDRLDHIADLGANVLYLGPVFASPSSGGHDTSDFLRVDPGLGDAATFQALVSAAEARGMRVLLESTFSYTSSDSVYFDRYQRQGSDGACADTASVHRDWYYFFAANPAGTGPCAGAGYSGWFGFDRWPQLATGATAVRDFLFAGGPGAVAPHWSQWVQGWRLSIAGDVDHGIDEPGNVFWEGFRAAVRAVEPDAWIVGEEWGKATPWLLGGEWDGATNLPLSAAILGFWRDETFEDNDHSAGSSVGRLDPLLPSQLAERLRDLQERYPPAAARAMMNLLGNHDTSRLLFRLDHNADLADGALYADPGYDWSDAITRARGAVLLQMTLPGVPTIYYGDELGLVGAPRHDGIAWQDDPYNRVPFPWLDETGSPFYAHLQDPLQRDAMLQHYRVLAAARHAHPALRDGSFEVVLEDDARGLFAFLRRLEGSDAALVVLNRSATQAQAVVDVAGLLPAGLAMADVLGSASVTVGSDGTVALDLPARGGLLLVADGPLAAAPAQVTTLSAATASAQVILAWSAVAGAGSYQVYRSPAAGGPRHLLGTTDDTAFLDGGVSAGYRYFYVVVPLDAATGLAGPASNEVQIVPAAVAPRTVAVTFAATVPAFTTGTVHVVGNQDALGFFDPGAVPMTEAAPGAWATSLHFPEGTHLEYTYTRGSWERAEARPDGTELPTLRSRLVVFGDEGTQRVDDGVANWRDPMVASATPAAGAAAVAPAAVEVVWSQAMTAAVGAHFSLEGPGGPVTGITSYDAGTRTLRFVPGAALPPGTYTVTIAGAVDASGDPQSGVASWTFDVIAAPPTPAIFASGFEAGPGA